MPPHAYAIYRNDASQAWLAMSANAADRLNFLRSVSIFGGTPDDVLAELSSLLSEVLAKAGEPVFVRGDLGDCLYIIAEGQVRVHVGERTLNLLHSGDVFGEMAALDPEVRSASVTPVKDTRLFRLEREQLYQVMATRVEVARGIIHVLSERVRGNLRDMREDFDYLQQFAKVTAAAAAIEAGVYEPESLREVSERLDALGQLARVFQHMATEVYAREQRLKQQVAELHIEVDKARKARQVAEITETDYFQELRGKARELRARK